MANYLKTGLAPFIRCTDEYAKIGINMKSKITYISTNHTTIMNNFGNYIKMKWYFVSIAFARVEYDEIIVSSGGGRRKMVWVT